jgi:hypothetical protein
MMASIERAYHVHRTFCIVSNFGTKVVSLTRLNRDALGFLRCHDVTLSWIPRIPKRHGKLPYRIKSSVPLGVNWDWYVKATHLVSGIIKVGLLTTEVDLNITSCVKPTWDTNQTPMQISNWLVLGRYLLASLQPEHTPLYKSILKNADLNNSSDAGGYQYMKARLQVKSIWLPKVDKHKPAENLSLAVFEEQEE